MTNRESALAHRLLDKFEGVEIGGNSFGLKTRKLAASDRLPLEDSSVDFVVSAHEIERSLDPIKTLKEWYRVVRSGGYVYVIASHKEQAWAAKDFAELVNELGWTMVAVQDVDDKDGSGFAVVIKVEKEAVAQMDSITSSTQVPAIRPDRRMSMTFLLAPTAPIRTAGSASVLEYARRFQERGHDVSITTWPKFVWQEEEPFPGFGSNLPIHYDREAKRETLPFDLLGKNPRDYLGELRFFLAYAHLVAPAIPKADLIIATNWEGIIPAWQSGKGKPVHFPQHYDEVFYTLDGSPSAGLQSNPLIKMLCRNAFQMPVYRIANSSWLAGEFRRRFNEKVPFAPHGIDTQRFHPRPKLSASDGILRVVTYCRPEKWKGFQDAVPAMHQFMRMYPDKIQWHVYGFEHPELGPGNPLAPYRFHGTLEHDELSRLYAESDIMLSPSWYESFPLPPLEAMACGTAVVTTPYGTEDYAIDGHSAIVVRPRIVSDFVLAMDGLARRPELRNRLARNGRAMAEGLTWEGAAAAREELLWRIHLNQMPNNALQGFDSGIVDSYGISFGCLAAEVGARDGELLEGTDGKHYLVESGRLRRVADPSAIGIDPKGARPLDLISLLRTERGPDIISPANYYGLRALEQQVAY